MINAYRYTDGLFYLYKIVNDADNENPDFPQRKLQKMLSGQPVWYRELAIYDKTRVTFEQADIEVTRKIRVPYWKGFESGQVCIIDDVQMSIFNTAFIRDEPGYAETELTLINPAVIYEMENEDA